MQSIPTRLPGRKKRLVLLAVLLLAGAVGVLLAVPGYRDLVLGYVNHEPTEDGWPLRHWVRLLSDGDPQQREQAAKTLGRLGDAEPEVLAALRAALDDDHALVRRSAAEALGRLGPAARSAAPALVKTLKDPDAYVRRRAARALGRVDPEPAEVLPALLTAARGEADMATRIAAITSLGRLGPAGAAAVPVLVQIMLEKPSRNGDVSEAARDALRHIGAAAVPTLIEVCRQGTPSARAAVARALRDMGEPARPAIAALRMLLQDESQIVQVDAAAALGALEGRVDETLPFLVTVVRTGNTEAKAEAMVVLGELGPQAAPAVGAITACLSDQHEALRGTAVHTLAKFGAAARPAIPALEAVARDDPHPELRRAAAEALAAIRGGKDAK